jgi:arylsulfatase A
MTHNLKKLFKWSSRCSTYFVLAICLMAACLMARGAEPSVSTANLPNLVFILADDLGYGELGCYGHPRIKTPNLDKLAKQGLKLNSYYSGAPVCSPSRAALLTGRIPQRDGISDWIPENSDIYLPRETTTLAKILARIGYTTALSGKWHLNGKMDGSQPTPGDHGFQHWFATQNNALPTHENPTNFIRNGEPVGQLNGYSSTLIVNEAIDWLKQRKTDQPFFLYVAFHAPHEKVATAEQFLLQYTDVPNKDQAQYFGNITQMDFEIGRLLQTLDNLKVVDNTLVFFSSDNGPETLKRYQGATRSYGSPGQIGGQELRGRKLHLYEGGIRVPALIRWPGMVKPGRESDAPVCALDWMATIRVLTGIRAWDLKIDGEDFSSLLRGGKFVREQPIYWQYDKAINSETDAILPRFALREGDYKLLVSGDFKNVELYNLRRDPAEATDIARRELPRVKNMVERVKLTYRQLEAISYTPKN